jgi:L-alanine-DL-glutamate epimerase-like enolase superfamily enzyme
MSVHRFDVPTRHVFAISRGAQTLVRTVVVELEHQGHRGYGEAGEATYYNASAEGIQQSLEGVRPAVERTPFESPEPFWDQMHGRLSHDTFALCALDMAAQDLWGKLRGQPLWKLWGLDAGETPATDYTIGIDTIDVMIAKLREFPEWPVYKIKLGTRDDLAIVRALRRETEAPFRVDANCAWGVEETIRNAAALAELGVELIEQPLPPGDSEGMREVFARSALPILADESCRYEADVDACAGLFHGVNIKLVKCGGLTPARRMVDRARQLGLKVMVGCMCETSVGISAAAQLLPLLDYADLDGALLLARDVARGVTFDQGHVRYPNTPGCGIEMNAE